MKVLWRGRLQGHLVELVICFHEQVGRPQKLGGPHMLCVDCGAVRLADWLPLLPRRFYRPVF